MDNMSQNLVAFLKEPAAKSIHSLPGAFGMSKDIFGTNLDFLNRVALEGNDILWNGDGIIKTFRFTRQDVHNIFSAYTAAAKALTQHRADSDLVTKIAAVVPSLHAITTYHTDKVSAAEIMRDEARVNAAAVRTSVAEAFANRDSQRLAYFFPHALELLTDNKDTVLKTQDQKEQVLSVLHTPEGFSAYGWFGRPQILEHFEQTVACCGHEINRNRRVGTGITAFANRINSILTPQ